MSELVLKGVGCEDELRRATDLLAKVHYDEYYKAIRWLETTGRAYPEFRAEHTRIAVLEGEVVAALRLNTNTLRIGEARLKAGGIGWVTTADAHRHRGYGRRLMEESLGYMGEHGYHLSLLFGIPNFYHRFGFAPAVARYVTSMEVSEGLRAGPGAYRLRRGKPGDIPAIQKIHGQNDVDSSCSIIRSRMHYSSQWEEWKRVQVLTNASGRVRAYFVGREVGQGLEIEEVGVAGKEVFEATLYACAMAAHRACLSQLRFAAPPNHPLIRHLLQYRSTHEMAISRNSGGMIAIVDLVETLESLIPEWEQQVRRQGASALKAECTLMLESGSYRVRLRHGAIDISPGVGANKFSLTRNQLVQLLTGYAYLSEVLQERRRLITPDGKILLSVLFPKRAPFIWPMDMF